MKLKNVLIEFVYLSYVAENDRKVMKMLHVRLLVCVFIWNEQKMMCI